MTIVTFASVKGAPGVTTLACLVGATWPEQRKVMVVECDPSGGDLAARFQLSSRDGWPSFNAAARRGGADIAIEPHLQQLPGGLDVLVGTRGLESDEATESMIALLSAQPPLRMDRGMFWSTWAGWFPGNRIGGGWNVPTHRRHLHPG